RISQLSLLLNSKEQMSASDVTTSIYQTLKIVKPKAANSVQISVAGATGSYVVIDLVSTPDPSYTIKVPGVFALAQDAPNPPPPGGYYEETTDNFTRSSTQASPWMIVMDNGDEAGNHRCRARVTLNGTQVVSTTEFGIGTAHLEKQVSLLSGNSD